MRRLLALLLLMLLPLSGCQAVQEQANPVIAYAADPSASAQEQSIVAEGWLSLADHKAAEIHNLQQTELGLKLIPGQKEGVFLSEVYTTSEFNRLVASWKIDLPAGGAVKIEFQVGHENSWSAFFPLGIWSEHPQSQDYSDDWGEVAIDTLELYRPQKQLRFRLSLSATDNSPLVRNIAWTTWLEEGRVFQPPTGSEITLHVPLRSQFMADAAIASEICSPASVAMLLEYYGIARSSEAVAAGSYDYAARMYGNWSFNVAYANSQGLPVRVAYLKDYQPLLASLRQGNPVICSIAFSRGALTGSPIAATPGHLVLICGFEMRDDVAMLLVNDPAAPDTASVARAYRADEFFTVWNGIAYLVDQSQSGFSASK